MDKTGKNVSYIASAEGTRRQQPTWSPFADKIIWTEITDENCYLIVYPTSFPNTLSVYDCYAPSFYTFWNRDGTQVCYLSSSSSQIDLTLIDLENPKLNKILTEGRPVFYSWAWDRNALIVNKNSKTLEFINSITGSKTPLSPPVYLSGGLNIARPATQIHFPTPLWRSDNKLIYTCEILLEPSEVPQKSEEESDPTFIRLFTSKQETSKVEALVMADLNGNIVKEIVRFQGNISFVHSLDNKYIAHCVSDAYLWGMLSVVDTQFNKQYSIDTEPVLAFFWSPNSRYLLYTKLTAVPRQDWWLQWSVWDSHTKLYTNYANFKPSDSFFRNYLQFYDQYAQSMQLWSPDNNAFCYCGLDITNRRGVFVQNIVDPESGTSPSEPDIILECNVDFVCWSPR